MDHSFEYDSFIEAIAPRPTHIKPMFGCRMLYSNEMMLAFIVDNQAKYPLDRGVAFVTRLEDQAKLNQKFPSFRHMRSFGEGPTTWFLLPAESDSFEEDLIQIAKLIRKGDPRFGRISPSALKKPRKKVSKKTKAKPRAPTKKLRSSQSTQA